MLQMVFFLNFKLMEQADFIFFFPFFEQCGMQRFFFFNFLMELAKVAIIHTRGIHQIWLQAIEESRKI
jgi:hypothetical protein